MTGHILIAGAGSGLSASIARRFAQNGYKVSLAARSAEKLSALAKEIGGHAYACDVSRKVDVDRLFREAAGAAGIAPDVVVYNASGRVRGPFLTLDAAAVEQALAVTAYGGFLVAQAALPAMVEARRGVLLFTGASASVKGYAKSAPFAMGKFALRGLAQSLAREFQPQGIHVAHVAIDGGIAVKGAPPTNPPEATLDPDAIAETYFHLATQPRSAWSFETELRPWVETF
ncbi:MAG: SDR family NAD(P)-dependent oxidoreductase [Hyphomicrobiales bacterium]